MSKDLLPLRDYQREAIDAVTAAWASGDCERPAVVLPTGMGKTVVFSHLIREQHATAGRAVVLVHRDELADQAIAKIRTVAPHLYVGKVKAQDNEVNADVVVASVQTIGRSRKRLDAITYARSGPVGLWITDECHHAVAPTYGRIFADPAVKDGKHVGFTATLARGDGIGLGSVWDDVVYSRTMAYAIKNGFLVRPRGISVAVKNLDLSGVKRSGGDYQAGDLGDALMGSDALTAIVSAYQEHGEDRPAVVFTPTVATAQAVVGELSAAGVTAAMVSGETPRTERQAIYAAFSTGEIKVLVNCMVLTEGFDAPHAAVAIIARPTQSQPLYVQMVGRVLRPFPGKTEALILDVVGTSESNKLVTLVDLEPGLFKEAKRCEDCNRVPCVCPCRECGQDKPCGCSLAAEPRELVVKGSGKELELFSSSRSAWLQTAAGVWFIPCGSAGDVFLWPDGPGTVAVCLRPQRGGWVMSEYRNLPLEAAMAWAEAEAEELGPYVSQKSARWRKAKPSDAQINLAQRMGIPTAGVGKGDLSDMISVRIASNHFDRHVGK